MGCACFRRFLSFFDSYSMSFQVQFHWNTSFQTNYGGIISLILYIILLAAFIFLYVLLHKKEEQKINSFDLKYEVPPAFNLIFDPDKSTYSKEEKNGGFFITAFYFINKESNTITDDFEDIVNVTFAQKQSSGNKVNDDAFEKNLEYKKCSEVYKGKNIDKVLQTTLINEAYCIQEESLEIKSDFVNREKDPYVYLRLRVEPKTDKVFSNLQLIIMYSDFSIDYEKHGESPLKYSTKQIQIDLIDEFKISYDAYVSYDEFHAADNLYAHWASKNNQKVGRINRIVKRVEMRNNEEFFNMNFRGDYYYRKYVRTYKTFFEFIYQIGGLWKVLVFIGGLLVVGINVSLMNVAISNQMFNMINPENSNDIKLTYDELLEHEHQINKSTPMYLSLNPILKKLCFEYYKYERNRGMNFSIKEALSKVFCCCCKIKVIENKDKIFAESGKEIEKQLDTKTVASFAQKSKIMNHLLLKKNAVMLTYMLRQNISYDTLYQIRQDLIQHKIINSATPFKLAYYKQNFFVNALTTMRNQGDLNKTDLLLIDLMKLNPDLICQFFISNFDKLELIYPEKFPKGEKEKGDKNNY